MPNGYKVRAFRFLTRSIDVKHFAEALFSAIKDIEQDKRFMVTDEEGEHIIRVSEICYLESKQRSTDVRTNGIIAFPQIHWWLCTLTTTYYDSARRMEQWSQSSNVL